MTRRERAEQKSAARDFVLTDLRREVAERERIVAMWKRGSVGDGYRREILRLWRLALRAVVA